MRDDLRGAADVSVNLPKEVESIISRLEERGFSAYAVGGAVRDCVLGLTPEDWDVTTSALPNETEDTFKDFPVLETGIKHGTVTVLTGGKSFEITTFRRESGYSDSRHPDNVEFVGELSEDLRRRDFTVNSLAYNEKEGLIDLYGGLSDLKNKLIRTVGKPYERFSEDALRILRAVRFASKLGFDIEKETERSATELKGLLKKISAERIFAETDKLLSGLGATDALIRYNEIICEIIPELKDCVGFSQHSKWHKYDVYEHIARSVGEVKAGSELKWAMLLHDVSKPECFFMKDGEGHFYGHAEKSAATANAVLKRLKAPNSFREKVVFLVKNHDSPFPKSDAKLKKLLGRYGEEMFFALIEVKKADNAAQGTELAGAEREEIEKVKSRAESIIKSGECFRVEQLKISGNELLSVGFKGKEIGEELDRLLDICISSPGLNTPEKLVALAEKHCSDLNKCGYKSINEGFQR